MEDLLEGFDLSWGLKRLMKERGISQGDIMRATGIERPYVHRLVTGKIQDIQVKTAIRLAHAFGMTCDGFVKYCTKPSNRKKGGPSKESRGELRNTI